MHKVLTYIEYRAVSGVFRTIGVWGGHTRWVEWWGGQYFGRRQTLHWPLTVKSLYALVLLNFKKLVKAFRVNNFYSPCRYSYGGGRGSIVTWAVP
jgi:hypothetical protein